MNIIFKKKLQFPILIKNWNIKLVVEYVLTISFITQKAALI